MSLRSNNDTPLNLGPNGGTGTARQIAIGEQVGIRIWQLLAKSADFEAVRDQMLAEYEVNQEQLDQDLADFIALLSDTEFVKMNS
jgi:flagellar motor switch protein FliG